MVSFSFAFWGAMISYIGVALLLIGLILIISFLAADCKVGAIIGFVALALGILTSFAGVGLTSYYKLGVREMEDQILRQERQVEKQTVIENDTIKSTYKW